MTRTCLHFINNEFTGSADQKTFANVAPATEEILAQVALGGAREIDRAVAAAKAAVPIWQATKPAERALILRKIADGILARLDEFARLESQDTGKPISETKFGDIPRAAANFSFFANYCGHQPLPTFQNDDGSWHTTTRNPLGVVGLITPWNFPLHLATWKIAPALVQGNTIVLKPAELTPMTATLLCEVIRDAGVPAGVVNVVHGFGGGGAGEALVRHPDVRAISFTGETTTGTAIMRDAAPTLKKLSFELGGKGASVIFADANLAVAAQTSARAAFRNQGEICLAGSRLLVEDKVYDEVLSLIMAEVKKIKVGDPLNEATTMGALISAEHHDKVRSYIEFARNQPELQVLCGGEMPKDAKKGFFLTPAVITGVQQNSKLIQEEIFGPVLTIQKFSSDGEALEMLNGTPYGLSCSIWSENLPRAQAAASQAQTGMVWINCWYLRNLNTPFGGMKKSGIGREGGQYGLDFFCDWKTIATPATF